MQNAGSCPERNGRFPDPSQCDAYIECIDGVPTRKLCPDGLLFKPQAGHFSYPCFYPPEVDCLGRSSLQPAQPSGTCPHQFGYYPVGDASHCGQFMICSNGIAHIFDCPEGLAFNDQSLRCEWPDEVLSCNAEAFLGFTCPNFGTTDFGPAGYTFYRSPVTCQKYYLCINGRPRLLSCSQDEAFNEITSSCDAPENVTGW
ncbi:hypothetical protein AAG570_011333 [Ranatra chinensis]|uniref:Chitin-binding type-2 domain-containing protein n=1 Tax=Ranatra chinensis TaxID=642074 RepID=A0ABD0YKB6_9HEMI